MSELAERRGMLEFYTGFDLETIKLLIRRLEEVRRLVCFFFFLFSWCSGCQHYFCPVFLTAHNRPWIRMLRTDEKATRGTARWTWRSGCWFFCRAFGGKCLFPSWDTSTGAAKKQRAGIAKKWVDLFNTHLASRLIFSPTPEELKGMSRREVLDHFPDLLAILDATNWEQLKPENFVENRLTYSAFKHFNSFQVLLGESPSK